MSSDTLGSVRDDADRDDLDADIDAMEAAHPGYRAKVEEMAAVVSVTSSLWRQREELGLTVEQVVERSGLSLAEVESIENNAVDTPFPNLARYAAAVGLRLDLKVSAA